MVQSGLASAERVFELLDAEELAPDADVPATLPTPRGHVVFAGSPPQAIVNGKELSGPTGYEHLVAISVRITPRAQASASPAASTATPRYESPWEDPTITQIYKAQG